MRTPLFDFNKNRNALKREVVERVMAQTKDPLLALNDAAYWETKRLADSQGAELADWRLLASSLGRLNGEEVRAKLEGIAERHAEDVAGNFDPKVYLAVSRAGAPLLGTLLRPREALSNLAQLTQLAQFGTGGSLDGRVVVQGPVKQVRALSEIGTVVYVPTHLSNLDSVVFGFAMERNGLPPATYGAGKNLFTNPVLSFFMHNLGAYKVDRRLKHTLYKDVLKAYSCLLIERGYHSLFFPGGTRSRSGGVERKLKLGLAGTGLEAVIRSARTKGLSGAQKVFFVPATINYTLTLEAETLIEDFLKEEGKSRYIIEDDESTRFGKTASFMQKLMGLDESVVIRFSKPMDCFGNFVDEAGQSYDSRGRTIDPLSYILDRDDAPSFDRDRDMNYTHQLGEAICKAFKRDTVILPTHLVAAAAFSLLERTVGKGDLFSLLRPRDHVTVAKSALIAEMKRLHEALRELADKDAIRLAPRVDKFIPETILEDALRAFGGYHSQEVIGRRGDDLMLVHTRLLFYYQNRLAAHGVVPDYL
ncbi:MAG: 1-acyl-sn-glycerol-3-phosphate acyltransferase [Polyangiaceae bacterium]|nr:1-acyl-sn-glycerol-3-phosphate acyltransferase [Polyangiaceae bacterium]